MNYETASAPSDQPDIKQEPRSNKHDRGSLVKNPKTQQTLNTVWKSASSHSPYEHQSNQNCPYW